ncbi:hypothetical protein PFISCL1PPCAC_15605 [Pristionchus fissidentatus]|uniref:Uncharacterized protein n=1 Tax=Pristionchus fissidentatus TaxID=1538716 RepID=A0AAV5W0U4_9BILA|nr:hypothetical protein PFISCL1PPCAC_15605 [Pristionchus fissidentatus]
MKMDMIDGLNGAPLSPNGVLPCATEIGREFVRQYYTLLSERPQDVHRFYSHESVFVHGELEAVGQQKIVNAIEGLGFDECKVRIHTIKGSHTLGQGIVLQVCGEMQENERSEPRRFIQTIVLCQQTPKKFFVQNDIFQFADSSFTTLREEKIVAHVDVNTSTSNVIPASNINGHGSSPVAEKTVKAKPDNLVSTTKGREVKPSKVEKKEENVPATPKIPSLASIPTVPVTYSTETKPTIPAPTIHVKEEPKTWAKLVGGGQHTPVLTATTASKSTFKVKEERSKDNAHKEDRKKIEEKSDRKEEREHCKEKKDERKEERGAKLYIGGITRNKIPDISDESNVIAEIFGVFTAFGEVESVQVPRKCYDAPLNTTRPGTAFAFVSMKTTAEAQKVFESCRKDDSNANALKVCINSFGFEGEVSVSVSEPKLSGPRPGLRRGVPAGGRGVGGAFSSRGRGGRGFHNGNQ